MSKIAAAFGAVLFAGLLAACAGGPVVYSTSITGSYDPRILEYVAGKGGMPVEVVGNPFAAPPAELEAVVAETMARSHFGPRFPFLTEVPDDFASPYRVVVAIDPAPGTTVYRLCAGSAQSQGPTPGAPTRVAAAFCARDLIITSANGSIAGATGPRDAGFVGLIGQLSMALFPPVDPDRSGTEEFF